MKKTAALLKKYIFKFFWIVCLILGVIYLAYRVGYKDICFSKYSFFSNCLIGFAASGIVGIAVEIIHDKSEQKNEKHTIAVYNEIIEILIPTYLANIACLLTISNQGDPDEVYLTKQFKITDMQNMFSPSFVVGTAFSCSNIEAFFDIEDQLKEKIMDILINSNFEYYKELQDILIDFISASQIDNCKKRILSDCNKTYNGVNAWDSIKNDMKSGYLDSLYDSHINGNNINRFIQAPYVYLYKLINNERKILIKYQDFIRQNNIKL